MNQSEKGIYLDANATTTMLPSAVEAMTSVIQSGPLNPSSAHGAGENARRLLTQARDNTSLLFGQVDPDDLIFTSGGTEGNWLAINSFRNCVSDLVISTEVEHMSVLEPVCCLGSHILIGVDGNGMVNIDQLVSEIKSSEVLPLVSIQWANSETGVIQPIKDIVGKIRSENCDVFIHADAAQAVGRLNLDFDGLDFVTCSAHKLHGPHGFGMLYISERAQERITSCFVGAGQEKNWRSGTVNVPAAVGTGMAFMNRFENLDKHISQLTAFRDKFEEILVGQLECVRVNSILADRLPNTSNIAFLGLDGMQLLAKLDAMGVMASQGSACSSAKPEPSKVLRAMGLSEEDAYSSMRFSFSILNTMEEIEEAANMICEVVKQR